ncbi:MAG TPA: hypothetical protein VF942_03975 [Acidimicrobiales bacterium]
MNRKPALTLAFVIGAALVLGVLLGVTALASGGNASAHGPFLAAASPSASPRSNETATHEQNETAAREAAENSGTFHPGGPDGHNGPSNETSTHEATESAAQEAAEKT